MKGPKGVVLFVFFFFCSAFIICQTKEGVLDYPQQQQQQLRVQKLTTYGLHSSALVLRRVSFTVQGMLNGRRNHYYGMATMVMTIMMMTMMMTTAFWRVASRSRTSMPAFVHGTP